MSTTFGESTSRKSSDFEYKGRQLWGVVPGEGEKLRGEYI
jgi:hypothetical protein